MAKVGEIYYYYFTIFDSNDNPVTGQAGTVSTLLTVNKVEALEIVTVEETDSPGEYVAYFTPLLKAIYGLRLTNSVDGRYIGPGAIEINTGDMDDIIDDILSLLRLTGNNVDRSGDIITIYEEDGTTIWRQYDLASGGRILVP